MKEEGKATWYVCSYGGEERMSRLQVSEQGMGKAALNTLSSSSLSWVIITLLISELAEGLHVLFLVFFFPPLHTAAVHSTPKAKTVWITLVLSILEFSVVPDYKTRTPNVGHSSPNG